jgi:hypothetical protein
MAQDNAKWHIPLLLRPLFHERTRPVRYPFPRGGAQTTALSYHIIISYSRPMELGYHTQLTTILTQGKPDWAGYPMTLAKDSRTITDNGRSVSNTHSNHMLSSVQS